MSANPTLRDEARIGLVGDFLNAVELETESHPAGMLIDYLVAFGNAVGSSPYMRVGADIHRPILNAVAVGATARGRKGTGRGVVRAVFAAADPTWADNCVVSGHASGEGLISDLATAGEDRSECRMFVEEVEFSSTLRVAGRDGSILSEVIRKLWDGQPVANRRSAGRQVVKKHHVSIVGNITNAELDTTLRRTDGLNGFTNRILWVHTDRVRKLPYGGNLSPELFQRLGRDCREALNQARKVGRIRRSAEADSLWEPWYNAVPDDLPGLWGAATARAEAYVLRISQVYALMDGSSTIEAEHIEAAIAVWDYCNESAGLIFGDRTGDTDVDKLIDALSAAGESGLDGTQQHRLFGSKRHRAAGARERAIQLGLAVPVTEPTDGRPRVVLYLTEYVPIDRIGP